MHREILLILGHGLVRQRFDNVHEAFLTKPKLKSYTESSRSEIITNASDSNTKSRCYALSPEMLPRPQITYSTISM
jgi:hypothetical protein